MVTWEEFTKRLEKLPDYLKNVSGDLLMKHEREIVALNNQQLIEGKNIAGNTMQNGYSTGYARVRKKAGLQTSFVDLKFSGKYQDSRKGQKASDGLNIVSGVDYEKYLRGNFPQHVGLDKDNAEKIGDKIDDELAKLIKKFLVQ